MGISFEDDANFACYLACINNPDNFYKYSGYYFAMRYVGNALYSDDKDLYASSSKLISDAVLADMNEVYDFWTKYENKSAAKIVDNLNEAYLKSNNQPDGVKSYGKVVDLIIAYETQGRC